MRKSKASIFIFAVLSLILVAAGAAIGFMIPSMVPALAGKDLVAALGETFTVLGATFAFSNPIFDITIVVALAIVAVLWIINLVLLIAKKKFGQLVPNLIWLLAGGLAVILFALSNNVGTNHIFLFISHLTGKETEAQWGYLMCLEFHRWTSPHNPQILPLL